MVLFFWTLVFLALRLDILKGYSFCLCCDNSSNSNVLEREKPRLQHGLQEKNQQKTNKLCWSSLIAQHNPWEQCPSTPSPSRHHLAEAPVGTGSPAHDFFFFNLRVKGKALEHWKTRLYVRTLNSLHRNIWARGGDEGLLHPLVVYGGTELVHLGHFWYRKRHVESKVRENLLSLNFLQNLDLLN